LLFLLAYRLLPFFLGGFYFQLFFGYGLRAHDANVFCLGVRVPEPHVDIVEGLFAMGGEDIVNYCAARKSPYADLGPGYSEIVNPYLDVLPALGALVDEGY